MQAQAYPPQQGPPAGYGEPYRRDSHYGGAPSQPYIMAHNYAPMESHVRALTADGRRYELRVEQQPQRARMCGFGDKDRRPVTPPPCVRLVITNIDTGVEVDTNLIDHSMFVLNVDLWDENGQREVNLVKHTANSPSIGSTIPVTFTPPEPSMNAHYSQILPQAQPQHQQTSPIAYSHPSTPYNPFPGPPQVTPFQRNGSYPGPPPLQYNSYTNGNAPPNGYPSHNSYPEGPPPPPHYSYQQPDRQVEYIPAGEVAPRNHSSLLNYVDRGNDMGVQRASISSSQPSGMYTRNLIGSLSASAFRLTDVADKIGIWFVLQDLSVRTEGNFRLRFSFVNVGVPKAMDGSSTSSAVNTGRAPVLAATFSDSFTVYSAKRFPGVVESTPLSKCFATQGIKIPIRKDGQNARAGGAGGGPNRDEDEDEGY